VRRQVCEQALVGQRGQGPEIDRAGRERIGHEALVHRGGASHGVVPVHVAVHLVLGEEQGFHRGQALLPEGQGRRVVDELHGVDEAVDIDIAVGDAAHERVALEVLDLVEVEGSGDEALERVGALASYQGQDIACGTRAKRLGQDLGDGALEDQRTGDVLVVRRTDLLQGMGERIVADVVEEHGRANEGRVLLEEGERAAGEVIGAEGVLKARVGRAGVDEVGEAELADIAQALHGIRVEQPQGERLDTDVVP
jgi:hypothetical protein